MTEAEDKEKGNLTVTFNYIEIAQILLCLRQKIERIDSVISLGKIGYDTLKLLTKLKNILDKAGLDKDMQVERRSGERRNGERRLPCEDT